MSGECAGPDRVLKLLQYDFPKAPLPVLRDAMLHGMRKVAASDLIQASIDLTPEVQACVSDYDFGHLIPEGFRTRSILNVFWCGHCLPAVDDPCAPCPHGYERCGRDALTLHPEPSNAEGQTLEVQVSLNPDSAECELPEAFLDQFEEAIRDFARADMMYMPDQPWSNERSSRAYRNRARASLMESMKAYTGHSNAKPVMARGRAWL